MSYFGLNKFTFFTILLLSHLLLTSANEAHKGELLNAQTTLVDHDVGDQAKLLEEEKPSMAKHSHFFSYNRKLGEGISTEKKKKKKWKKMKSSATQIEMSMFHAGSIFLASILFGFLLV
ncbi:uncharacterized protein DS421_13g417870 [Arachis hypogaea]|nr:uncharacterized protein DS421_13g417870 [Arachis hypogaea]